MMLTNLRGEISIEKSVSGSEAKEVVLAKFMESFGDNFDGRSTESLNAIAEILQPMVAQTCAIEGNLPRLMNLVEEGLDVSLAGKNGKNALHIAVAQNDAAMVELFPPNSSSILRKSRT